MSLGTDRSTTESGPNTTYERTQVALMGKNGVKKYSASGAISPTSGIHLITKGTPAGAFTLVAPPEDGIELTFVCGTAFAHVLTPVGGINDGVTGGAKTAYTAAAFVGSSITLVSAGALWHVKAQNKGSVA